MTTTPNLDLPYLAAGQAQKHVTLNESLRRLDALVQIAVEDRDIPTPPTTPVEGVRYLVPSGATGAWQGRTNQIAAWQDGGWTCFPPARGWVCWVADEQSLLVFNGMQWEGLTAQSGGSGNSPWVLIQQQHAVNVATVDFTTGLTAAYDWYCLTISGLQPALNNQYLRLRTRTAGGAFRSAASDYRWARYAALSNNAFGGDSSNGTQSGIAIGVPLGNAQQAIARIEFARPNAAQIHNFIYQVVSRDNAGHAYTATGGGAMQSIEAIDGIRLYMDSGNINAGTFTLLGLKKEVV